MKERGKFENEWNSIFDGVQDKPSDKVWSEIKAELAIMEANKQRNKVIYWRWFGAAASVIILLMVAVYGYNYFTSNSIVENELAITNLEYENSFNNDIQANSNPSTQLSNKIKSIDYNSNSEREESVSTNVVDDELKEINATNEAVAVHISSKYKSNKSIKSTNVKMENHTNDFTDYDKTLLFEGNQNEKESSLLSVNKNRSEKAELNIDVIDEVEYLSIIDSVEILAQLNTDIYMQKIPDLEELFKYNKKKNRNMWAGVSVGGGSFNPNVGSGDLGNALFTSENITSDPNLYVGTTADITANEATETPSFAYNFSVDFGKFITKKFLIESGVEYAKYSSEASSNLTSNTSQQPEAFLRKNNSDDFSYASLQNTTTYELLNSYEYVSLPISLGYTVMDRKIGILISSGVSVDVFLNNTLKDLSGEYASAIQKNGDDSPYRPINFNALLGGEIYYSWSENYVLAIDPGYRISLSRITKQDANFNSRPTSFMLGLKFKYLL
ncbi:MAG: hypothetical protein OEW67_05290 [Cyclobacteriaceae bacterium]|nr:hypothetical protein [Cyclobacteriaceae bacterium]